MTKKKIKFLIGLLTILTIVQLSSCVKEEINMPTEGDLHITGLTLGIVGESMTKADEEENSETTGVVKTTFTEDDKVTIRITTADESKETIYNGTATYDGSSAWKLSETISISQADIKAGIVVQMEHAATATQAGGVGGKDDLIAVATYNSEEGWASTQGSINFDTSDNTKLKVTMEHKHVLLTIDDVTAVAGGESGTNGEILKVVAHIAGTPYTFYKAASRWECIVPVEESATLTHFVVTVKKGENDSEDITAAPSAAITLVNEPGKNELYNFTIAIYGGTCTVSFNAGNSPSWGNIQGFQMENGMIKIYSVDDLKKINTDNNSLKAKYILMNNLDLGNENWTPIGLLDGDKVGFSGHFNGNGYTIKNLTINRNSVTTDSWGLFAQMSEEALVYNLHLENVNIKVESAAEKALCVGAIEGYGSGKLNYCSATNVKIESTTKNSYTAVGGLVGLNAMGTIVRCWSNNVTMTVKNESNNANHYTYAGGIAGFNADNGRVVASYVLNPNLTVTDGSTGTKGRVAVGGIAGSCQYDKIEDVPGNIEKLVNSFVVGSYAKHVSIKATGGSSTDVGALVGFNNEGFILNSYATGTVDKLVGKNQKETDSDGETYVKDCVDPKGMDYSPLTYACTFPMVYNIQVDKTGLLSVGSVTWLAEKIWGGRIEKGTIAPPVIDLSYNGDTFQ